MSDLILSAYQTLFHLKFRCFKTLYPPSPSYESILVITGLFLNSPNEQQKFKPELIPHKFVLCIKSWREMQASNKRFISLLKYTHLQFVLIVYSNK